MVPERQVWILFSQPPREKGRVRPLGYPIGPVPMAEAPLPACLPPVPPLPQPGTSCACFFCTLYRQEMGMRWR